MKNIIICISFMLPALTALGQIASPPPAIVDGSVLRTQTDLIKILTDKIFSEHETTNASLAEKARTISYKIVICKNSLGSEVEYPVYLKQLFDNYESVLNLALNTSNTDSAALALNFIDEDLSAKTASVYTTNGDSAYYDTAPMVVKVDVVDSNGVSLNGYEVKARPFFMLDAGAAFNFHRLTKEATENIIPGWYMFIVQKGALKKEKDFKILRTNTEPVLLTIPVQN